MACTPLRERTLVLVNHFSPGCGIFSVVTCPSESAEVLREASGPVGQHQG